MNIICMLKLVIDVQLHVGFYITITKRYVSLKIITCNINFT